MLPENIDTEPVRSNLISAPSRPAGAERSIFSLPGGTDKASTATLQLTCRLEKADGTLVAVKTFDQSRPLKERTPAAFVQAQSANLAELSNEIAKWLPQTSPSSK